MALFLAKRFHFLFPILFIISLALRLFILYLSSFIALFLIQQLPNVLANLRHAALRLALDKE